MSLFFVLFRFTLDQVILSHNCHLSAEFMRKNDAILHHFPYKNFTEKNIGLPVLFLKDCEEAQIYHI